MSAQYRRHDERGNQSFEKTWPHFDRSGIDFALSILKRDRAYAKATHNSWAADLIKGGAIKGDDGESGAGMVIVRMLQREGLRDHLIVVTRWYGGKHLGGDRFGHVQTCVRTYLDEV
jgi:putative IMPACT (imprinted ancient) family translation regulator